MKNHNQLIKGVFFLMIAGFLSRFIGFFYRIYLSNTIGAKNLGIYQLIFPIYGICYTIYASGIQTAISKIVASKLHSKSKYYTIAPFLTGTFISLFFSLFMSSVLYNAAPYVSINILKESSCKLSLQILSLVFPFCGLTACINGFYYAINKTLIPSLSQLIEQLIRVSTVVLFCYLIPSATKSCTVAVIGLVLGEFISCIYMLFALFFESDFTTNIKIKKRSNTKKYLYSPKKFISYTYPLTLNKLLISILNSIEAILIPIMLVKHGLPHNKSLALFGILTGMSMSFIMFPSAITNSLSVVLLPTISSAHASNQKKEIQNTVEKSLHYSYIIGILSLALFIIWGVDIGVCIFNNKTAGIYIQILAWLCPFIYSTTTLISILNGLGKTKITFKNTLVSSIIKLIFVLFIVPIWGIYGYLIGLLFSSILSYLLNLMSLNKHIPIKINIKNTIIKPVIITLFTGSILKNIYCYIFFNYPFSKLILLFIACTSFIIICIITMLFTKTLSINLFKNK